MMLVIPPPALHPPPCSNDAAREVSIIGANEKKSHVEVSHRWPAISCHQLPSAVISCHQSAVEASHVPSHDTVLNGKVQMFRHLYWSSEVIGDWWHVLMWCWHVYCNSAVEVMLNNRPFVSESRKNRTFLIYTGQAVIVPEMTTYTCMQIVIKTDCSWLFFKSNLNTRTSDTKF